MKPRPQLFLFQSLIQLYQRVRRLTFEFSNKYLDTTLCVYTTLPQNSEKVETGKEIREFRGSKV